MTGPVIRRHALKVSHIDGIVALPLPLGASLEPLSPAGSSAAGPGPSPRGSEGPASAGSRRLDATMAAQGFNMDAHFFSSGSGPLLSHTDQGGVQLKVSSPQKLQRMQSAYRHSFAGTSCPAQVSSDMWCTLLLTSQLGFGQIPNMRTKELHQGQLFCKILMYFQQSHYK